jgi:uncharacterized iron-regulated membrane protein
MKLLSPGLVKSSLQAHSWLGLLLGGLMYLICLTGTIVVFYLDIERWEQPTADEYRSLEPELIQDAFRNYVQALSETGEHLYVVFPSDAIPRIKFATDTEGHYLNEDGSIGPTAHDDWSHLITGLHINLHMPINIGIVIVSAIGALFLGLIISGFLAHPTIFKDAFSWRRSNSERMAEVDLHNRLSVWGAPFHIMIAITGAYFGLVGLLIMGAAEAFYDGDRDAATSDFFTPEPELQGQPLQANLVKPLDYLAAEVPDGNPLFMVIHDASSEQRFQEYYVQMPGRMIYSENYRFDMQGNFIDRAGYSDGSVAQQVVYSIYRLHFGHFGGLGTKLLYVVLGLALTVVSVSGVNIWLIKRKKQDAINTLWAGIIWGTPLALLLTGITQVLFHLPSTAVFWGSLIAACAISYWLGEARRARFWLKTAISLAALLLLLGYCIKYGAAAFSAAGLSINLVLLFLSLGFALPAIRHFRSIRKT